MRVKLTFVGNKYVLHHSYFRDPNFKLVSYCSCPRQFRNYQEISYLHTIHPNNKAFILLSHFRSAAGECAAVALFYAVQQKRSGRNFCRAWNGWEKQQRRSCIDNKGHMSTKSKKREKIIKQWEVWVEGKMAAMASFHSVWLKHPTLSPEVSVQLQAPTRVVT